MAGSIHGGAFWNLIGSDLPKLESVVRADVLDAWFPPAPSVIAAFGKNAVELCRTSPEASGNPLRKAISSARGIDEDCILVGGGSSSLMFLAVPLLAGQCQSAVILDPMYGEYRYILEEVCACPVSTVALSREEEYVLDPDRLMDLFGEIVVVVNPNSPTGKHVPRADLAPVVQELARTRIVWIDETYIEYAGAAESLEYLAARNPNIVVCKSMSKVYALSGLRAAYLVSHPDRIAEFARRQAPWSVSLPALVCASVALDEDDYYRRRYRETVHLRAGLAAGFRSFDFEVTEGVINCLLVHLPKSGPSAAEVCREAQRTNVYLRDAGSMGSTMGYQTIRVSVRSAEENERILRAVAALTSATV